MPKRVEERSAALLLFPRRSSQRCGIGGKSETSIRGSVHWYRGRELATRELSAAEEPASAGGYRIRSGGAFAIVDAGQGRDRTPRGRKARAILAYLSSRPACRAPREALIELLWGDRGQDQARASLRQSLLEIRQACGDLVQADREQVWIDEARLSIEEDDAGASEAFANLNHVSPEFDAWLRSERDRRAGKAWDNLRREVEALLAGDRGAEAIPLVERMRRIDPYNEDWVRLAMQAQFQAGHPAAIDRYFNDIETLLKQDLGVAPASETRALRDRLLAELTKIPAAVPNPAAGGDTPAPAPRARRPWLALASAAAVAAAAGAVWVSQPSAGNPPRIAVLPFEATEVEPALAAGMSDELLSQLSRNQGLRVIGRTSSDQFKGRPADLRLIGRTLDVQYIVEGNVRSAGDQVWVAVTLVRAKDGSALWARTFHGSSGSLESIQQAIGSAVGGSLNAAEPVVAGRRVNGEAYMLYVRAKALIRNRDQDSFSRATELLREANRIDPKFPGAWTQLAVASYFTTPRGRTPVELSDGTRISQREAVERALKLDPSLAEAHAAAWLVNGGESTGARAHLRRALELDPNDPQTLYWWGNTLAGAGELHRAAAFIERAARLDPLWKRPVMAAMEAKLVAGDRSGALNYLRTIKAGNPPAAVEVEADLAFADGDYSRVVQLTIGDRAAPWDDGKFMGTGTLVGLGLVHEALLMAPVRPVYRALLTGRAPAIPMVLDYFLWTNEPEIFKLVIEQLTREKRWSDIAALYDADLDVMRSLRGNDPGARDAFISLGPLLAIGLHRAGRRSVAARVALATGSAAKVFLASGDVPPDDLVRIAGAETALGHRDQALAHLERAFAMGWRMEAFEPNPRIGENPVFATMRGNPRFERLQRIQDAHLAKERREVLALNIL